MKYRQHNQPGCGGCLFLVILLILLSGGTPLLFDVLGTLFYIVIFAVLFMVAAFWGVFIWKELKDLPKSKNWLIIAMFIFFLIGLGLIIYSRLA
jgi:hypothetical protein